MKILIAEDKAEDRTLLRLVLESHGHVVVEAANGQEGLDAAADTGIELIISDVLMPVMDGFEFLRNIRKRSSVTFIFYSAVYDSDKDMRFASSLGADGYLVKPRQPLRLMAEIEAILKARSKGGGEPLKDDAEYLENYGQILAAKLQEKVKELEALLLERAEQEERISSFVNNAPGFFYTQLLRPDGSAAIPFASAGIKELLGLSPEAVQETYQAFTATTHPEDRETAWLKTVESARDLIPFHLEYRVVHPEKGTRWVECRGVPQRRADGGTHWHGFMHDITDRKSTEERLREKRERLNVMALELSLAEERERRAIATELHDRIGQDLTLATIKLGMLGKEPSSPKGEQLVGETRELLNGIVRDVRSLTHRISPPILELGSLEAALKWLARQVEADYGLQVAYRSDRGDCGDNALSEELRSVIYHAVRELLINAAKHARATMVRVLVARGDQALRVEVIDDGVGFDACDINDNRATGDGFGLFNVRRRICHLGGSFGVQSRPGQGTRVTLAMPFRTAKQIHKGENVE